MTTIIAAILAVFSALSCSSVPEPAPCELYQDATRIAWQCGDRLFGVFLVDGVWVPAQYTGE